MYVVRRRCGPWGFLSVHVSVSCGKSPPPAVRAHPPLVLVTQFTDLMSRLIINLGTECQGIRIFSTKREQRVSFGQNLLDSFFWNWWNSSDGILIIYMEERARLSYLECRKSTAPHSCSQKPQISDGGREGGRAVRSSRDSSLASTRGSRCGVDREPTRWTTFPPARRTAYLPC